MLSVIGLVAAIALLIYFSLRGLSLFLTTPICAAVIALTGGIPLLTSDGSENLLTGYAVGFATFFKDWFFMFLLGALFGQLMENTGAAQSIAHWIVKIFGHKYAILSVIAICALLTYGGVSVFIVAFTVYPMALGLFKDADIPHRFIPAALAFGSGTFTMTSAGSQEIQNWIPTKYLGTTPYAAWEISFLVALFMMVTGFIWLKWMVKRANQSGEGFGSTKNKVYEKELSPSQDDTKNLPHPITAVIPLVMVLLTSYFTHKTLYENALIVALLVGCISLAVINYKFVVDASKIVSEGTYGALLAIGNTSAVVGFGTVVKLSPAFAVIVATVTNMEGSSLLTAAVAITLVAGITGSASGGQTIVLPELAPHYLESGMNPEHLHRITSISSGALGSMPHNGYAVTTIRVICQETHKTAYLPMAGLTLIIPVLASLLAIFLMNLGI